MRVFSYKPCHLLVSVRLLDLPLWTEFSYRIPGCSGGFFLVFHWKHVSIFIHLFDVLKTENDVLLTACSK